MKTIIATITLVAALTLGVSAFASPTNAQLSADALLDAAVAAESEEGFVHPNAVSFCRNSPGYETLLKRIACIRGIVEADARATFASRNSEASRPTDYTVSWAAFGIVPCPPNIDAADANNIGCSNV